MLNLIQSFFSNARFNKSQLRSDFEAYFFSMPEHQWLNEPLIKNHFTELFSYLPIGIIEALMNKYPVVFIQNQNLDYKSSPGKVLFNTVVVFPEFQRLLMSEKKSAVAYLAHELAFVLLELEGLKSDSFMAEIEADKFVSDLGLTFELEELLLMLDESVEKRVRLTYLTINHFSSTNN